MHDNRRPGSPLRVHSVFRTSSPSKSPAWPPSFFGRMANSQFREFGSSEQSRVFSFPTDTKSSRPQRHKYGTRVELSVCVAFKGRLMSRLEISSRHYWISNRRRGFDPDLYRSRTVCKILVRVFRGKRSTLFLDGRGARTSFVG